MNTFLLQLLFWIGLFIVFYSYVGYGLLLYIMVRLKRLLTKAPAPPPAAELPEVTFVVAAYNEEDWMEAKINNCLAFDYPRAKLRLLFVTDGSSDRTPDIIRQFPLPEGARLDLFHESARRGKIAAVHRIMGYIDSPITIYTDANTMVNSEAIKAIVAAYENPKVGAVAGEKRVRMQQKDAANAAGEGMYWKYESKLKQWDDELYSVVGGAGELFSIRTELYQAVPPDTIIEDFVLTLGIAMRGYRIAYAPEAYAVESSSASVKEELKRKIRIAAGGLQAIVRLAPLLNIFRYGLLSFQYISHRVLRWTLAPALLPVLLVLNGLLALYGPTFYGIIFVLQLAFYGAALLGWVLENRKIKVKLLFIPFYFCMMNYAVYRGFGRFIQGRQSVLWERAKRAEGVA